MSKTKGKERIAPEPLTLEIDAEEIAVCYAGALGQPISGDMAFRHTAFAQGGLRVTLYRPGEKHTFDLPKTMTVRLLSEEDLEEPAPPGPDHPTGIPKPEPEPKKEFVYQGGEDTKRTGASVPPVKEPEE